MAKAKNTPKDQHKSGFMVRLPEAYREKLRELQAKTDRPFTSDVRRALDAYLTANGVAPPAQPGR